ncbi:MAG: bifunctional hydroxymethylpyrimidine kinase/phosphomethylpyrimidine kinase [Acetobacteraceae bacterium]|nr:bifunctional hydroxymethylpyrimidine kinase/phosphomethylpyrimidine kinase [Acetobacteraceae bacterium]MBV8520526.1 bifunctional hydroxymethylpyrimidine kinase/phosphomethylpyrimidine kinase [Acetobacteraceae bacterium]
MCDDIGLLPRAAAYTLSSGRRVRGRVLVIGGSDPGGGAGIQADIKTITALGAYAATAITALTVQDTVGVHAVLPVAADFIRKQAVAVLEDIGADAIKTGMLGNAASIAAIARTIQRYAPCIPLVVDPVMVAKGGAALLALDAIGALKEHLIPMTTLLTPNVPEAEVLAGMTIRNPSEMRTAVTALLGLGARAVLLKGGHLSGDCVVDLLATGAGITEFASPRIATRHTHGTGCTLASAIAAGLAQGRPLAEAIADARAYVWHAIETAPGLGRGHGPLNHVI